MTEKPILFSGPLVRAIIEGRKTQTRRVIKPDWYRCLDLSDADDVAKAFARCPYGEPGDQLWVRETWSVHSIYDSLPPRYINQCPKVSYWADGNPEGLKVRQSIFMPRWASRIDLLVTGIRVERVQDISWQDAIAEGVVPGSCPCCFRAVNGCTDCMDTGFAENPVDEFSMLWDGINKKRGFGWESNPWVWCVDFERIDALRKAGSHD